jgi:hypothetical protein
MNFQPTHCFPKLLRQQVLGSKIPALAVIPEFPRYQLPLQEETI